MTKQKQMTEKELDQVSGGPVYVKLGDKESSRTIKFRIERKNTRSPIHCITPSL
jgi:bacteriocin-like protein